ASMLPAAGATEASVATSVQVTLSEPIDPATVTQTSFRVSVDAVAVAGSFTFFNNNTTVRFTPAALLPFGTLITVQLTAAITDVVGNPLTQPLTFTFTTGTFTITNPRDSSEVVENAQILLEAHGSTSLNIATVTFSVNGQALPAVSGPPFAAPFT